MRMANFKILRWQNGNKMAKELRLL